MPRLKCEQLSWPGSDKLIGRQWVRDIPFNAKWRRLARTYAVREQRQGAIAKPHEGGHVFGSCWKATAGLPAPPQMPALR